MNSSRIRFIVVIAILVAVVNAAAAQEEVLYSFSGNNGDANPAAGLIFDSKGNLYGTTNLGNSFYGTVFELTFNKDGSWTETVLYSFPATNDDGAGLPGSIIMDPEGNLYGTNEYLGQHECGTAFELIPESGQSWKEKILHQFGATSTDACRSKAGLVFDARGNLYGTTYSGGAHNLGTVFELSPQADGSWTENVLWSFAGGPADGSDPEAGLLLDAAGNVYGTTNVGGTDGLGGVVFELTPQTGGSWTEKVLYSFCPYTSCVDGFMPQAGLIFDKRGNLYGTTAYGGQYGATSGTVFQLSPQSDGSWKENIIHNFHGAAKDGTFPIAGLVFDSKGNLFGTTNFGGSHSAGTVFKLAPDGTGAWSEEVVYNFGSEFHAADGNEPMAGLVLDAEGNLYGTTSNGGANGSGTVFEIANPDITAVPTFSLPAGTYTSTQKVTVSDYTSGAKIYCTTNGDEPSAESSDEYSGAIEVKHTETIKAIAVADGLEQSMPATAKYVIHLPAETPEITPLKGTYHTPEKVTITDATSDAAIYYTTDGEIPTPTSGRFYRGPFRIYATTTIIAIAIAPGRSQSKPASDTITIHLPPAATPVISPTTGTYSPPLTVHISDTTPGATIYYTIGGSKPTTSSTVYTSAGIKVTSNETIQAIAKSQATSASLPASATYTIQP